MASQSDLDKVIYLKCATRIKDIRANTVLGVRRGSWRRANKYQTYYSENSFLCIPNSPVCWGNCQWNEVEGN